MNKIEQLKYKAEKYTELIKKLKKYKWIDIAKILKTDKTVISKINNWVLNLSLKKIEIFLSKINNYEENSKTNR